MAALTVVISGDASKLQKEMDKINAMAAKTGRNIQTSLNGGGRNGEMLPNAGAMREAAVLVREISRGNWSRIPGSLSIMLSRLGGMKYILHPVTLSIAALAAGFYGLYYITKKWTDELTNFKMPDIIPKYIAQHLQKANAVLNIQKEITAEVMKTVEAWNSVAEASARVEKSNHEHFDHLRKMAHLQGKGPEEIAKIDAAERQADLAEKHRAKMSAEIQAGLLGDQAKAIVVPSEAADNENLRQAKEKADAARAAIAAIKKAQDEQTERDEYVSGGQKGPHIAAIKAQQAKELKDAQDYIAAEQRMIENAANNAETRKRRDDIAKQAAANAALAARLGLEIPAEEAANKQKNQDEAEEAAAEAANKVSGRRGNNRLTNLQQVGAFAGSSQLIDVARKSERHLSDIKHLLGGGRGRGQEFGGVRY